jgi:transcriptional regulator with XRE-family HTH domain
MDMYDFSILRNLRQREQLNLAAVSAQSGVSTAVISKLERNQTVPALDTLYRIARVFGMHPSDLLKLAECRSANHCHATKHRSNGINFSEIRYGNIRCLLGRALAGDRVSRPKIHKNDYEVCWVLEGHLRFSLPQETHELKAGDAIQFDAILEHTYEAIENTKFLIVHLQKDKSF